MPTLSSLLHSWPKLRPVAHQHLLLIRAATANNTALPSISLSWIEDLQSPHLSKLLRLSREQGLDADWISEQFDSGASAVVATTVDDQLAGMGLMISHDLWIQEIHRTFNPGVKGAYLYCTYVSPNFRGRHIQQLVDLARIDRAHDYGATYAYAIVESLNRASLRAHARSGFRTLATVMNIRMGNLEIFSARWATANRPKGCGFSKCTAQNDRVAWAFREIFSHTPLLRSGDPI